MVKILHLYYDLMNLYGEYANISILCDNLKKNNIDYDLKKYSVGDEFNFDDFDFIYCGSGTENKTELAKNDFVKRKESFCKAVLQNKHILFTGSSMFLLGSNGIDIFDYTLKNSNTRICGDVICDTEEYKDIVGYINTSYLVESSMNPTVKITHSDEYLKKYFLGYKENNLFTINITGPLLVKNPQILNNLLTKLSANTSADTLSKHQYMSYSITLEELKNRFN